MDIMEQWIDIVWTIAKVTIGLLAGMALGAVVLWWRSPKSARLLFRAKRNDDPVFANVFDDKYVELQNPRLSGTGITYDPKHRWHFLPTSIAQQVESNMAQTDSEKKEESAKHKISELFNKAFRLAGQSNSFFFAYSRRVTVVNPEVHSMVERTKIHLKEGKVNSKEVVKVDKEKLIEALQQLPDKYVDFEDFYVTDFQDPRDMQKYIPQLYPSTVIDAIEQKVRELVTVGKGGFGFGGAWLWILILAMVGGLVLLGLLATGTIKIPIG
jgi:hypothetical protein